VPTLPHRPPHDCFASVEIQLMPLGAETPDHRWLGYTEGQRSSNLISTPKDVSVLLQRYGKLRSQAHDCRATVSLLEQMRGAL